jgi:hypothetical protein
MYVREKRKACSSSVLGELNTKIDVIKPRYRARGRRETLNGLFVGNLLTSKAGKSDCNRWIERSNALSGGPCTVPFPRLARCVVRVVN